MFIHSVSVLVRVLQRKRTNRVSRDIDKRRFPIVFGFCSLEPRKPHHQPPTTWKTRKADGVTQSSVKAGGLRSYNVNPDVGLKAREPRLPMSQGWRRWMDVSGQVERVNLPSLCLFVLFQLSWDWMVPPSPLLY